MQYPSRTNQELLAETTIVSHKIKELEHSEAERRRTEEALLKEKAFSDRLLDAPQDTVFLFELVTGKPLKWNKRFAEVSGYSDEEIAGMKVPDDFYNKEDLQRAKDAMTILLFDNHRNVEMSLVTKQGAYIPFEYSATAIKTLDGKPLILTIGRDITERRRAEEALRVSESRARAMLQAIPDMMFRLNSQGIFLDYKTDTRDLDVQSEQPVIGKYHRDIFTPEFVDLIDRQLRTTLKTRRLQSFEYRLTTSDQGVRDYEARMVASGADEVTAIVRDITEQKWAEEELLRAKKLEALSVLAGGIAHDFNNLMMVVQGYIDLVLMDTPSDHVSHQRLLAAMKSVEQTKELTSRLITFSRGGGPIMELCDVREIIRDSVHRTVKGSKVRVKFDFMENLWSTEIDILQMKQCFYNLSTNAVEAMPQGGTLTIQAENMVILTGTVLPLKEGSYLKITFNDEGAGIPQEHLLKVFDPYFTTKGMGAQKGMGLGLAVCYSVLKKHNGHISVESQPGQGASFALYLPVRVVQAATKEVIRTMSPGTGKVLIMDDEPQIRDLERAYLEGLGYAVTDTKDGQEAVDAYREALASGAPFDLVLLDLTVRQGLGGTLAMERLLMIDPGVRAIIASGYVDEPVLENYGNYGFLGALKKPFKGEEIRKIVETILHKGT